MRIAAITFLVLLSFSFPLSVAIRSDDRGSENSLTATPSYDAASAVTDFSDYIFPTNAGRKMTSSFAEFRRTHFHGGVDIGTGSTTGFEVYAMRDGYVSRIRVSPTGYGKMLYVRHADGFTTTYAHLDHFNVELDALVSKKQHETGSYPLDIECSREMFPVRKGDLIAYTGETGVGTPHLHFEIRDPWMDFVNPLQCTNLSIYDDIPPMIKRVAFSPIGEDSRLDGGSNPRVYAVRQTRNSVFKISEPIDLSGEGGFAIEARDRSNGSNFKHGVHGHKLFIDDSLVYSVKLDRAPSNDAHHIAMYYDWNLIGRGRLERLYVNSPNAFRFYLPTGDRAGVLKATDFSEGAHPFRIVTSDFAGNTSTTEGTIVFHHPVPCSLETREKEYTLHLGNHTRLERVSLYFKKNSSNDWNLKTIYPEGPHVTLPNPDGKYDVIRMITTSVSGHQSPPLIHFFKKPQGPQGTATLNHEIYDDFVRIIARTNRTFTSPPSVVVYEGELKRTLSLAPIDIDHYSGSFRPRGTHQGTRRLVLAAEVNGQILTANDEFEIFPVVAGSSGTIQFDNGNLTLSYEPTSVFKTVLMQIRKDGSGSYSLHPENTILNSGMKVAVRYSTNRRAGLFFDGFGGEELLDDSSDQVTGMYEGRITRSLGDVYVSSDDHAPAISRLQISRLSEGRPVISFRFGDHGSGVDYKELKMYIDNVIAVPEIDGEHHRAIHRVTTALERGSHLLTIRIKDNLGNSSEVERRFTVR